MARTRLTAPLFGVTLLAGGIGLLTVLPSAAAAPARLYFHSANGGYAKDVANDPGTFAAPAGSTLSATKPAGATAVTAVYTPSLDLVGQTLPGAPNQPTFALPSGLPQVTTVCYDLWLQASDGAATKLLHAQGTFMDPAFAETVTDAVTLDPYASGVVRVTGLAAVTGKPTPPDGSWFLPYPYDDPEDAGWTLSYDSTANPSSITLNASAADCTPAKLDAGSGATPVPTASSTSGAPDPTATADPGGTPGPTDNPDCTSVAPTDGATGTPTDQPAVRVADPTDDPSPGDACEPLAVRDTVVSYTGVTDGRYGDDAAAVAKVTTADDGTVPAGTVSFSLGSAFVEATVDADGVARADLPVQSTPGAYVLEVHYAGAPGFGESDREAGFTVQRNPTACALLKAYHASNVTLTARVRDGSGRPMAVAITFFKDGKALRTARTGDGGTWATTVTKRGTYKVSLGGNAYYAPCSATAKV